MKGASINKVLIVGILLTGFAGLFLNTVQPTVSLLNDVSFAGVEKTKVSFELYDIYFADYSKHPDLDTNRFTLKLLMNVSNPYDDREVVIPRLSIDIYQIDKPVGRLWTNDEYRLEPFKSNSSHAAGFCPIYLSLYIGGTDSGFAEFLNSLMLNQLDSIKFHASINIGDLPINAQALVGEVLNLVGMNLDDLGDFDFATMLIDTLGGDLGSIKVAKWNNAIIGVNNTDVEDFRALMLSSNQSIFNSPDQYIYFGNSQPFNEYFWVNGSSGNSANGDGIYVWEYYGDNQWNQVANLTDNTDKFTKENGSITFNMPDNWQPIGLTDFYPDNFYYLRVRMIVPDSGINATLGNYIRMNVPNSRFFGPPPPPDPQPEPEPEPEPQPEPEAILYPAISPDEFPEVGGLQADGRDLDEYLLEQGIDLEAFMLRYLVGYGLEISTGILVGFDKTAKQPWIFPTAEDNPQGDDIEVSALLYSLFGYLASHNINPGEFLVMCEIQWADAIDYLATEFDDYLTVNGTDIYTGEYIYANYLETEKYQGVLEMTKTIMIGVVVGAMVAVPVGLKKKDQTEAYLTHSDIANLKAYTKSDLPKNVKVVASIPDAEKRKSRWEVFGALGGLGLGVALYYLKNMFFPLNDDMVYVLIPEIFKDTVANLNNPIDGNPYNWFIIAMAAFLDFPSCLAWIIPAFVIAYKRNTQFENMKRKKAGWSVFWHGAYMIEFLLALSAVGLIVGYLLQNTMGFSTSISGWMSYFSGLMVFLFLMFLSPYFWLGLLGSLVGGFLGTRIALHKPGKTTVLISTVEKESKKKEKNADDGWVDLSQASTPSKPSKQKSSKQSEEDAWLDQDVSDSIDWGDETSGWDS